MSSLGTIESGVIVTFLFFNLHVVICQMCTCSDSFNCEVSTNGNVTVECDCGKRKCMLPKESIHNYYFDHVAYGAAAAGALMGALFFAIGVVVGVACSIAVLKFMKRMEGKSLVFTPWPRIQAK